MTPNGAETLIRCERFCRRPAVCYSVTHPLRWGWRQEILPGGVAGILLGVRRNHLCASYEDADWKTRRQQHH
ncbi:hypothetical protein KCP69_04580 [Salmonella enterica subsp. enterica]|nr:hypothetical protein KCP69_04580 [Salmonella enterica subsp. enterica]